MFQHEKAKRLLKACRKQSPTIKDLLAAVGGLSEPSKMPWYGWSISAYRCKVGGKLRRIVGSVCERCYATKGRYRFGNVQTAQARRLALFVVDPEVWAVNMTVLLEKKSRGAEDFFRWFDSGDLQSEDMIDAMIWIAKQLPHIKFWLPTKEAELIEDIRTKVAVDTAPNLCVRLSAPMMGQTLAPGYYPTSSVDGNAMTSWYCPAKSQDNKCGDCRACWDKDVRNVDYYGA